MTITKLKQKYGPWAVFLVGGGWAVSTDLDSRIAWVNFSRNKKWLRSVIADADSQELVRWAAEGRLVVLARRTRVLARNRAARRADTRKMISCCEQRGLPVPATYRPQAKAKGGG